MKKLTGTGVALVTPFTENLEVDFDALKALLQFTATEGVDYFVVSGTTGESATTTDNEKAQILQFVKDNNPHQLPIIYGLGGNDTRKLVEDLKQIDLGGVDAILSVSPAYNKPTQEGIFRHYILFADNSPVPVILYNVPGRTASNITADTTLRLAAHPNIIGIKEASGNMQQCMEIANQKPEIFLLISGDDLLTPALMGAGAVGVISVLANAFPSIFKKMVHEALQENFIEANKMAFSLLRINNLMYQEGNPTGIKEVLRQMKLCKNPVRLPLLEASEGLKTIISKELNTLITVNSALNI